MRRTKTAMGVARRSKQSRRKPSQFGRAPQSLGGALDWSAEFVGGLDLVTRVGAETKTSKHHAICRLSSLFQSASITHCRGVYKTTGYKCRKRKKETNLREDIGAVLVAVKGVG